MTTSEKDNMTDFIEELYKNRLYIVWGTSAIVGFIAGIVVGLNGIK
ncbi:MULTISPECIES: hypothetical protein [Streptococcus]|nr:MULTISPECIES: hypothetical protein [Streptococcus]